MHKILRDENGVAKDFRFVDVNPAYEKVMGVCRAAVIGKTFGQVWPHPEDVWVDNMICAAERGIHAHFEGYSREVDRYLHSMAFPVSSQYVGVLFLDITDWRQSEEALDQSRARLLTYRKELQGLITKFSLAEEKVRRAIATEIHDGLGYTLIDIMNGLKAIDSSLVTPRDRERMAVVLEKMRTMMDHTRKLTFQISSPVLYEVGLGAALKKLGEDMILPHGIVYLYKGKLSDQGISDEVTILLYQIVRELFVNIVKHAKASRVSATLRRKENSVTVVVDDDGVGMTLEQRGGLGSSCGFGLFSIRERLSYIGGCLQVYSEPGRGCSVVVNAPVSLVAS